MNPTDSPTPEASGNQAAENIVEARQLLQTLQEQVGKHPVLEEAIVEAGTGAQRAYSADRWPALAEPKRHVLPRTQLSTQSQPRGCPFRPGQGTEGAAKQENFTAD